MISVPVTGDRSRAQPNEALDTCWSCLGGIFTGDAVLKEVSLELTWWPPEKWEPHTGGAGAECCSKDTISRHVFKPWIHSCLKVGFAPWSSLLVNHCWNWFLWLQCLWLATIAWSGSHLNGIIRWLILVKWSNHWAPSTTQEEVCSCLNGIDVAVLKPGRRDGLLPTTRLCHTESYLPSPFTCVCVSLLTVMLDSLHLWTVVH